MPYLPNNRDKNDKIRRERKELLHALGFFSQIGFMMAACVFIGVFAGSYLDKLLGTTPWLLLVFSLLGAVSALKALFDLGTKR